MRPYGGNARETLRRLREAKEARPRKAPDPNDPVAVRWDRAHRIRNFLLGEIKDGNIEPYEPQPVEDIYAFILKEEQEEQARKGAGSDN